MLDLAFTFSVPASQTSQGPPPMGPPPPSSQASRPPPVGSYLASSVKPANLPVMESETLLEDVLKPLKEALEDCRGHTKVISPGTLVG